MFFLQNRPDAENRCWLYNSQRDHQRFFSLGDGERTHARRLSAQPVEASGKKKKSDVKFIRPPASYVTIVIVCNQGSPSSSAGSLIGNHGTYSTTATRSQPKNQSTSTFLSGLFGGSCCRFLSKPSAVCKYGTPPPKIK